jgi:hypothetical protein
MSQKALFHKDLEQQIVIRATFPKMLDVQRQLPLNFGGLGGAERVETTTSARAGLDFRRRLVQTAGRDAVQAPDHAGVRRRLRIVDEGDA